MPQVATQIVQQVPCMFAKSTGQTAGTHPVTLMLNEAGDILYLSCACEAIYGTEPAEGMQELGTDVSCFQYVARFRSYFGRTTNKRAMNVELPWPLFSVAEHLNRSINEKRNGRLALASKHLPTTLAENVGKWKAIALRRVIKQNMPKQYRMFTISFLPSNNLLQLNVLNVGVATRTALPRELTVLPPLTEEETEAWNRENYTGKWTQATVSSSTIQRIHSYSGAPNASETCYVCDDKFERMGKHLSGKKHIEAFQEMVRKAMRVSSREGVRSQTWIKRKQWEQRLNIWK